ncbi:DNA/RNA helicase, superfamily II [Thioflavicoccus mobilis 8321]|uniref:ATP-dependent RNA helicase RhlB n=1 Tax=Thioflavicoccus mobilis 8321 TaxID=765912 RepID=L0GXY7_9GAMM|nr:ATP-dependent RNA helicase RhlB [Thioflavicoccus mobilis]AGA90836.1 DNA/RNA helicase, superfamily II [Thioflavicoccus mobilis 8321]
MTETHLTDTRFDSFDLDTRILKALDEAGFTHCTPIQAETLPIGLAGRDVAGQAQTGTGKTAAFLIVTLQRLLTNPRPDATEVKDPRVLILAPTRELAVQIHRDTLALAKHTDFRIGLVYGGTGYQQQRDDLARGVDILIGTPGRLIDYFKQKVFSLRHVEVAILDEADRMFDLGFIKDIRFLLRRMPPPEERLGLLFSATLSYRVTELAYEHMNNPELIKVEPDRVTAERVTQSGYMVANEEKIPLLIGLLRRLEGARAIVFANTKRETERIWGYLEGNGLRAAILSGDVPQRKRLSLLRHFTAGDLPILVATDVAARGLHIPDVTHVINYDLPEDAQDYVHRIGRTARAGAAGAAISFVCETYAFSLPDIEDFIGIKVPIDHIDPDLLAEVDPTSRVRTPRRERISRDERGKGRATPGGKQPRGRRDGPSDAPREEAAPAAPEAGQHDAATSPNDNAPSPKKRRRRRRRPTARPEDGQAVAPPPAEQP